MGRRIGAALGLAVVLIGIPCVVDYERFRGNMHACESFKKAHPSGVELNNDGEVAFVPCYVDGEAPALGTRNVQRRISSLSLRTSGSRVRFSEISLAEIASPSMSLNVRLSCFRGSAGT